MSSQELVEFIGCGGDEINQAVAARIAGALRVRNDSFSERERVPHFKRNACPAVAIYVEYVAYIGSPDPFEMFQGYALENHVSDVLRRELERFRDRFEEIRLEGKNAQRPQPFGKSFALFRISL